MSDHYNIDNIQMKSRSFTELFMRKLNPLFQKYGLKLIRYSNTTNAFVPMGGLSQKEIVKRLEWLKDHLNFQPSSVLDVGASDGRWTIPLLEIFPKAQVLMIEPLEEHAKSLSILVQQYPGVIYRQSLVGEKKQTIKFAQDSHRSSIYQDARWEKFDRIIECQMVTIDEILKETGFPPPELIKLDIEGAEKRALEGASCALKSTEIVEMEINLIPFKKNLPLFDEVVSFMSGRGFRIFDCFGILGRPVDGMPAQGECIFIRKDSKLISNYSWDETL
jgi:FkbM family methyltransferase